MSIRQAIIVHNFLKLKKGEITKIVHGGCIGADVQFHELCRMLDLTEKITVHPGYSKSILVVYCTELN